MEELPIDTTVYSMSPEPPPESKRGPDEQQLTLFRVGSVLVGGRRELCLVKNISAGGALIRAYCRLEPDTTLEVELKERQPIPGRITWVHGNDAGIGFDEPVDVIELLKATGEGPRPRMPRVEVRSIAFVREGAILHRVVLQNISQGGVSVESPNPPTVGANVTVSLPGLPPQSSVVRWNDGTLYGIGFNSVLPLVGLVQWLHARNGA